ncbi:MAG: YkgJ family cysteine cluster protein [Methanothrix sp.]|nr:YkgJ family cysteine cluster protein [Methanothrix sp.]
MDKESFLQWLSGEIPETLFPQIAAQVLFHCENCGECCRGEGYALVDVADIEEIAGALAISPTQARARLTDPDPEKNPGCRILKSTGPDRSCCLLDRNTGRCTIYSHRPRICRTFPMISEPVKTGEIISFYSDCRGTAKFVEMIQEKRSDPRVLEEIESLAGDEERLQDLRIMLFIWLSGMMGETEQARQICGATGISLPQDARSLQKDCLAYFLMTITTDGLDEYEYDGPANRNSNEKTKRKN